MINLTQKGVVTLTVATAAIAIAGASVGTPVAVDEVDTQPDNPLYALEKAGESIKGTFADGENWHLERAKERTSEYEYMAKKGKPENELLEQANNRVSKALRKASRVRSLHRAENVIKKNVEVLENVREKVPETAKPAISLAISKSTQFRASAASVSGENLSDKKLPKQARKRIENKIKEIERETKRVRKQIHENMEKGQSPSQVAQNIALGTARKLMKKAGKAAQKGHAKSAGKFVEMAHERSIGASELSENENGLQRAIEAGKKHLDVLENVYNKVPEQAKSAIQQAMEKSYRHVKVLENIKENGKPASGEEFGEKVRERVRKGMKKMEEKSERSKEWIENKVKERIGEEKGDIIENVVENIEEDIGDGAGDEDSQETDNNQDNMEESSGDTGDNYKETL